ncbi:hypothetical protein C8R47DRAFT_1070678 [Mycena vitilis]|nr:hypothetical protein C8R47DRAFT_1070678 [Mycena vitilis]
MQAAAEQALEASRGAADAPNATSPNDPDFLSWAALNSPIYQEAGMECQQAQVAYDDFRPFYSLPADSSTSPATSTPAAIPTTSGHPVGSGSGPSASPTKPLGGGPGTSLARSPAAFVFSLFAVVLGLQ